MPITVLVNLTSMLFFNELKTLGGGITGTFERFPEHLLDV
jgi:hypothetical protein